MLGRKGVRVCGTSVGHDVQREKGTEEMKEKL